jgi:hypothetical protein
MVACIAMAAGVQAAEKVAPNGFDKLGYFPVTGQAVAVGRALYGNVKMVTCLALAILSTAFCGHANGWASSAADGLLHVIRAGVEMIPVLGGIITFMHDSARMQMAANGKINELFPERTDGRNRFSMAPTAY